MQPTATRSSSMSSGGWTTRATGISASPAGSRVIRRSRFRSTSVRSTRRTSRSSSTRTRWRRVPQSA